MSKQNQLKWEKMLEYIPDKRYNKHICGKIISTRHIY